MGVTNYPRTKLDSWRECESNGQSFIPRGNIQLLTNIVDKALISVGNKASGHYFLRIND